jgi:hypothetical protein
MSSSLQSFLALAVVAATVGIFVWKAIVRRKKVAAGGCVGGCGCHATLVKKT